MDIEERANKYAYSAWGSTLVPHSALIESYKQGAIDQQKIDIEKVCEWLEANSINYIGRDGITNWRAIYKDFRKVMEEEL